jgi:hypothetical protein
VQVDRGPGTASTLGYATFGGTVAITSTTPSNTARINPYATLGTHAIKLYGLQLDSDAVPQLGGARGFTDAQGVDGLGALSGTRLPAQHDRTYDQVQPAIDARYTIRLGWVAYAQTARGFVAPPINVLYTNAPVNLTPQNTWSYQVGTTYQTDAFIVSADGYYIDFSNRIASRSLGGGDPAFFNSGGTIYKGLEFEGTVRVRSGVSHYSN